MSTRLVLVAALFTACATAAVAAPVRHAGEWQTTIDNGTARISCFPTDEAFDEKTIMHTMAQMPGAQCKMNGINSIGPVTSYSMQCIIQGGSVMTTSGTVTATGFDSFTSRMHSHGGAIPMANGKIMAMPDMDMTMVSRRLGACKPGDHINRF